MPISDIPKQRYNCGTEQLLSKTLFALKPPGHIYKYGKPKPKLRKVLALLKDILVVDDHYDIVYVLQIMLQNEGFTVHGFTDPFLALDYFKTDPEKFRLIITDVRMPSMSGVELLVKIKEIQQDAIGFLISAFERDTFENEIRVSTSV